MPKQIPTRSDIYYENGHVKQRDHNPDAEPLPEYDPPAALKSGAFLDELAADGDDYVLNNAQRSYQAAQRRWQELETMRENPDPRQTRAAHLERLNAVATSNRCNAIKAIDDARQQAMKAAENVDRKALESLGLSVDPKGGPEVRAAIKTMSEAERRTYISEAIEQQDTGLLSVILNAPHPVAVGFKTQAELKNVREWVLSSLAPGARQRREAYQKANRRLVELTDAWIQHEDKLTCRELRKRYDQQAAKAENASKAAAGNLGV
jgi:hypothetical protein